MSIEVAIAGINANAARFAYPMETAMIDGGMEYNLEKAHFLAQVLHESQGFSRMEENLNYSAERLQEVFGKYFRTETIAERYAHNPVRIGSRVYANRMGNGDEDSRDGYNYRGRGPIGLTGRGYYRQASLDIFGDNRLEREPWLASEVDNACKIAVWVWQDKACKAPALNDDIYTVTRRINGGLNGIDDRKRLLAEMKIVFGVTDEI